MKWRKRDTGTMNFTSEKSEPLFARFGVQVCLSITGCLWRRCGRPERQQPGDAGHRPERDGLRYIFLPWGYLANVCKVDTTSSGGSTRLAQLQAVDSAYVCPAHRRVSLQGSGCLRRLSTR
ncbi:hypothetical protein SESBI_31240 [Sesbania bispinosa]|nr:hypothetical protein SESBI_31240 [Sesbania bispinosa]